jgi:hypothetical protein
LAWLLAACPRCSPCRCRGGFRSLPQDNNQPHDEHPHLQRHFLRQIHYPLPLEEAFRLDGADQSNAIAREDESVPPSRFLFQFVSVAVVLEYEVIPPATRLLGRDDNPTIVLFENELLARSSLAMRFVARLSNRDFRDLAPVR